MSQTPTPGSTHAQATQDLNQVFRTLQDYPGLTRALIDPGASTQAKQKLVATVFPGMAPEATGKLAEAWKTSWQSTKALVAWVETAAVEAAWTWAALSGTLVQAIDEVFTFGRMMITDHELRAAVTDRRVDVVKRQDLVHTILSPGMTPPAVAVAVAAVSSRRGTIDDAVRGFIQVGARVADAQLVVATVAKPLSDQQRENLGTTLQTRLGSKVILEEIVDPTVLGGVRLEIGSEVIDSTMSSRLEIARRSFA
ncbi:MAG: F0F1 ATP synthase subunit delta [Propionibacteriaceae bacterium]|nr:F0F1 ATP synthase subunit delta [Propionibacteriaceae bacterium]